MEGSRVSWCWGLRGEGRGAEDTVDRHVEKSESLLERGREGGAKSRLVQRVIHCVLSVGVCLLIKSRSLHVYVQLYL